MKDDKSSKRQTFWFRYHGVNLVCVHEEVISISVVMDEFHEH
jgi:hypothetical protein